jgi:hypothetical protein
MKEVSLISEVLSKPYSSSKLFSSVLLPTFVFPITTNSYYWSNKSYWTRESGMGGFMRHVL